MARKPPSEGKPETYAGVTREIAAIPLAYPEPLAWAVCFGASLLLLLLFFIAVAVTCRNGIGMSGNNIPVP